MPDEHAPGSDGQGDFFHELDTQLLVHELKSPLSLIEATTRTLLASPSRLGPLTPRQEKALGRILRGAVRGRRLVEHLLEIGRAEAEQFAYASIDPVEAVHHVVLDAAESADGDLASRLAEAHDDPEKLAVLADAGITIAVAPGVERLRLDQDPVKLDLIVGNLVQNALRFRHHVLALSMEQNGSNLVISVRDDGPGVAPEHQAAIFERYRQAPLTEGIERKGHGLGLAGALILARRLGGNLTLESAPGEGATFRLTLPTEHDAAGVTGSDPRPS